MINEVYFYNNFVLILDDIILRVFKKKYIEILYLKYLNLTRL